MIRDDEVIGERVEGPKLIGFIGLGNMGAPMASNLLNAGFPVVVWNRTESKARPLVEKGATWADGPRHLAEKSDVVITMLEDARAVREVLLGAEGVVAAKHPNLRIIDMSTISPKDSRDIAQQVADRGMIMIDSPVSGSVKAAADASLTVLVGGEPEVVESVLPILRAMGKNVFHLGPNGMGCYMKLVNNVVLAARLGAAEAQTAGRTARRRAPGPNHFGAAPEGRQGQPRRSGEEDRARLLLGPLPDQEARGGRPHQRVPRDGGPGQARLRPPPGALHPLAARSEMLRAVVPGPRHDPGRPPSVEPDGAEQIDEADPRHQEEPEVRRTTVPDPSVEGPADQERRGDESEDVAERCAGQDREAANPTIEARDSREDRIWARVRSGEPGDAEDPDERIEDLAQAAVVLAEDDRRREDEKHLAGDRHRSPGQVDLDQRAESREAGEEARQSEIHEEGALVPPPIEMVGRIPNATDRRSRRHSGFPRAQRPCR